MVPKALTSIVLVLFCINIYAQTKPAKADSAKTAPVLITVSSSKNQPRKGEQVILQSKKTSKAYMGRTAANGKLTLTLPAGDDYLITVKALSDTTQWGTLQVPALGAGEYFTSPFTVDITYDPAKIFTLDNLQFDVGKATIRASSLPQLQDLLEYLQWKTDEKMEIAGHTDNVGKDDDNLRLSQQRSDAVKAWLVKKGIAADRLTAKGYGSTQPIADNSTEEGRQKNRRTEVKIL